MDKAEKIKKFMSDERMSTIVFNEIREVFLTSRGTKDVYTLAGERIAIELLDKAWKKMLGIKESETDSTTYKQVGL